MASSDKKKRSYLDKEGLETLKNTALKKFQTVEVISSGSTVDVEADSWNDTIQFTGNVLVNNDSMIEFPPPSDANIAIMLNGATAGNFSLNQANNSTVNISGLATTADLSNYVTTSALTSTLASYVTNTNLTTTLSNYALLSDIPTVNNGKLVIKTNGSSIGAFTANQAGNSTVDITIPTKLSDLTDDVVSGNYLPTAGGTMTGTVTSNALTPFNSINTNGYTTAQLQSSNNYGILELGSENVEGTLRLFNNSEYYAQLRSSALSTYRNYRLPDADGTVALTSDIPSLDNYVTETDLSTTLSGYVTNTNLASTLSNYALSSDVTSAINDLNYSDTAVNGQYVSKVSEANGIISVERKSLPAINNGKLTIAQNGSSIGTFTANQSGNSTVNVTVPTSLNDLSDFIISVDTAGTDLNDYTTNGIYYFTKYVTPLNVPTGNKNGYLFVLNPTGSNSKKQIWMRYSGDHYQTYVRTGSTTWSDWVRYIVEDDIAGLDYTDTAVSGKYVSAVSETDGKISVTRANLPTINNGKLTIAQNGSSIGSFTANQSGNSTVDITVPTKLSDLTDDVVSGNYLPTAGGTMTGTIHSQASTILEHYNTNDNLTLSLTGSTKYGFLTLGSNQGIEGVLRFYHGGNYWEQIRAASNPTTNVTYWLPPSSSTSAVLALTSDIPNVYNSDMVVKVNGSSVGKFTGNQSSDSDIDITVPTSLSDLNGDIAIVNTRVATDLNDYKTTGIWHFPHYSNSINPTNIPAGVNGTLIAYVRDTYVKQIWYRVGTNNSNDYETYVRQYKGGSWSNWRRYAIVDEVEKEVAYFNNLIKTPFTLRNYSGKGIVFTDNRDGTFTISGTSSSSVNLVFWNESIENSRSLDLIPDKTYTFSCDAGNYGNTSDKIALRLRQYLNGTAVDGLSYVTDLPANGTTSITFTQPATSVTNQTRLYLWIPSGTSFGSGITFSPRLTHTSTDVPVGKNVSNQIQQGVSIYSGIFQGPSGSTATITIPDGKSKALISASIVNNAYGSFNANPAVGYAAIDAHFKSYTVQGSTFCGGYLSPSSADQGYVSWRIIAADGSDNAKLVLTNVDISSNFSVHYSVAFFS